MPYTHLSAAGEDLSTLNQAMNVGSMWPPRLGSSFPYFSRAFDLYMRKETLLPADHAGLEDVRMPSTTPVPNITDTGFLSPSYLRGSSYLKKLEEKHRARLVAERDGNYAKGAPPVAISVRPSSSGSSSHLPVVGSKASGATHRGVAYDVVEKPLSPAEEDDGTSPLPSRWSRDDKEDALEVLADGYEVRHTGRAAGDHEASAVRADHYMSPACGVYYFEITVLNTRIDKLKYVKGTLMRGGALANSTPGRHPLPLALRVKRPRYPGLRAGKQTRGATTAMTATRLRLRTLGSRTPRCSAWGIPSAA
jgi:hypothetical protein